MIINLPVLEKFSGNTVWCPSTLMRFGIIVLMLLSSTALSLPFGGVRSRCCRLLPFSLKMLLLLFFCVCRVVGVAVLSIRKNVYPAINTSITSQFCSFALSLVLSCIRSLSRSRWGFVCSAVLCRCVLCCYSSIE